jgi:hypothetical protein
MISTVLYGKSLGKPCYGLHVNGQVFIPNVDIETFFKDILGESEIPEQFKTMLSLSEGAETP